MYTCEKCNQVYAEQVTICAICGHDVIKPSVSEPIFIPVSVAPDTTTQVPETSDNTTVSKTKGIIGFVMTTECFASSIIIMMYSTLLAAFVIGYGNELKSVLDYGHNTMYTMYSSATDIYSLLFVYFLAAICEMCLGIIGLVMISKAKNSGYTSKLTSLGKTFGIIGTVISGVSALLLFCTLFF